MKKRNYKLHFIYLSCIASLTVISIAVIVLMRNEQSKLLAQKEEIETLDREQLIGSIEQAEEALRLASHTESAAVYASKLQQFAEGCAGAALLTQQRDPSSAWGIFWTRLTDFAEGEITNAIGKVKVEPNSALIDSYADILAKLKRTPEAIDGPLWEDLPDELKIPNLQTEFSIGDDALKTTAAKKLKISGSLLKKVDSGMQGIARYRCSNAEIDLLISGQLVYLDLELPQREGNIGRTEGIRRLTEFVGEEGYSRTEVVDLYEHEGVLWAKMVPTVKVTHFGDVKNLDRPLIAACTLWSGRVCHFEVKPNLSSDSMFDVTGEVSISLDQMLSEKRLKKLAEEKNATLGESVICRGKLCRTFILDREEDGGEVCLYVDVSDGSERELALRYAPLPSELPASAIREDDHLPAGYGTLPPYADFQRRRYRSAVMSVCRFDHEKSIFAHKWSR